MLAIITENAPPRLRGRLSLLLLEVKAGVYLGDASPTIRTALWDIVILNIEAGSAVIAWPDASNLAGVEFQTVGKNKRNSAILDGLRLVSFTPIEEPLKTADLSVDLTDLKNVKYFKDLEEESPPRQRG